MVYVAPPGTACAACPCGCTDASVQVPANWPAVSAEDPDEDVGDVGEDEDSEQANVNDEAASRTAKAKRRTD
jgi:hypothetical protein